MKKILIPMLLTCLLFGCTQAPVPVSPSSSNTEISFGDTFVFDNFEITFTEDIQFATASDGREAFSVPITLKNIGTESSALLSFKYKIFNPSGTKATNMESWFEDSIFVAGQIRPDATLETLLYILYEGDGTYVIEFGSTDIALPISK